MTAPRSQASGDSSSFIRCLVREVVERLQSELRHAHSKWEGFAPSELAEQRTTLPSENTHFSVVSIDYSSE